MGKIWQFQEVIGVKWLVVIVRLPKCRLRRGHLTHHYICVECGSLSSCPIYTKILGLRSLSGIFSGLFKRPQKDTHILSICKEPLLTSQGSLKTFPVTHYVQCFNHIQFLQNRKCKSINILAMPICILTKEYIPQLLIRTQIVKIRSLFPSESYFFYFGKPIQI